MNKIAFLILILPFTIFGQSIEFEKISKIDSLVSKENYYNRLSSKLIEYVGGQSKYDKSIIQSNKELGVIKFKQELTYGKIGRSDRGVIKYNVNVFFKDGRYRIILNDFFHEGVGISLLTITNDDEYPHKESSWLSFRKKSWKEIKTYIEFEVPKILASIEKILNRPSEVEEEW